MTSNFEYAVEMPPQSPEMEVFGGRYILKWHDRQIKMTVDRFLARNYKVEAEVTVEFLNRPEGQRLITKGRPELLSTFRTMIADCEDFGGEVIDKKDWKIMFKQMSILVLDRYRQGEPVVNLSEMKDQGQKPYLLSPFIYEDSPTIIYGRGGVGKSLFCLYLAVLLQTGNAENRINTNGQKNVLYLDWEADPAESKHRASMIARGMRISEDINIHYRFCTVPLALDVESIQNAVADTKADLVIIDSAVPACGGNAIDPLGVTAFSNALRSLSTSERQVASLIIGHTTKVEDKSGGPFGSVVWRNFARTVWEFRSPDVPNTDEIDVVLIHQKINLSKLLAPIGFRITWGAGEVKINELDARRHPSFSAEMPLGERISVLLEDTGVMSPEQIETSLGNVSLQEITQTLSNDARFSQNGQGYEIHSL
jgi:hypothetical protein